MITKLGWKSLSTRKKEARLITFYKITNDPVAHALVSETFSYIYLHITLCYTKVQRGGVESETSACAGSTLTGQDEICKKIDRTGGLKFKKKKEGRMTIYVKKSQDKLNNKRQDRIEGKIKSQDRDNK